MGEAVFPPCCLIWGQTRGNENNDNLLQKVPCCSQCPHPWSRPPLTHTSAGNSWTLMDMSGSASCGVTAPFSWVLVHTRFCLCPPRVCFLVLCKFWHFYGGVNGNFLQEGWCHTQVCCTQSPCLCGRPLPPQETLRHSSGSVSVGWACILCPFQDCKEIQPVHPKGNQSWIFTGSTDAEAETPVLWPPDAKNQLIGKDPDAGKDWRWEEKGWDGWMASLIQWTWVWVGCGSWWWTGMWQPMGLQRQTPLSDWTNWTSLEVMGISSQWLMRAAEGFPMSMAEARGEKLFLGVLGVGIQKRVSSWWEGLSEIKKEEKELNSVCR